jgi:asparaginyl-tRNA synthetase
MTTYVQKHTNISDITTTLVDSEILVCGWVRTARVQAKRAFLELYDGSKSIQAITEADEIISSLKGVSASSFVKLVALVVKHPEKEGVVELNIKSIVKIAKISDPLTYPIGGRPSLEFLRDHQSIRGLTRTIGAVMTIKSSLAYYISDFMRMKKLKKYFPPTITASDCEGAGETLVVTKLMKQKVTDIPVVTVGGGKNIPTVKTDDIDWKQDFFQINGPAALTVSAQLHLEACLRGGGGGWCELPSYRGEESHTGRHLAVFTHIEWELMCASLSDLMDFSEEITQYCFRRILEEHMDELEQLDKFTSKGLIDKLRGFIQKQYVRISYDQAVEILHKPEHIDLLTSGEYAVDTIPKWGDDLGSTCERFLSEFIFKHPVLVHDYPASLKSFYMKQGSDGRTVESCDLLVPGLGELIGSSVREDDYEKLMRVVTERKMDITPLQWYVDLRKDGSVDTAGAGLGFERLVCICTGMHIRDVVQFIQACGSLKH